MESAVFRKKVELLDPEREKNLKTALEAVATNPDTSSLLIKEKLEPLFLSYFARLCKEEGVKNISTFQDEMALKDRLPDTVANWLTVLSEIFSSSQVNSRVSDPAATAAILLLRLYEWINWNYDRRLIYNDTIETEAEAKFSQLENEMDLLGDKDEILSQVLDSLSGFCSNYWIDEKNLYPGVKTYYLHINFDYGQGPRTLRLGLKSVLVDQVKLRALCQDQHILSHILESMLAYSTIGNFPPGNYI